MSKGKKSPKLTKPQKPISTTDNEYRLTNPMIRERPVLGMTLMRISGAYSLQKFHHANPDKRNLYYQELEALQRAVMKYPTIEAFLDAFTPRHGEMDTSKGVLKEELERVRKICNSTKISEDSITIRHIHSKAGGKGQFTLFGFRYENVFEILLLDPEHEIAQS